MLGRVNLKTVTEDTPTVTHNVQIQIQNQSPDFPASKNQTLSSPLPTLPILTDPNAGFQHTMISFDPTQLYSPGFIDVSEINASSSMMSLSQDGSSISDSSLIATENKCLSVPEKIADEATQVLMNCGFGGYHHHFDLVNDGFYSQEKIGELASSSFYPHELIDFGYADMKHKDEIN